MSGGFHVFYDWWNFLAQTLFGPYYWAPVLLNVGMTFVGGLFLARLATLAGYGPAYSKGLAVLFLLHWDVLAWSSVVNVKEVLVVVLAIAVFTCFARVLIGGSSGTARARAWAGALALLFLCLWLRFYIAFLLAGTLGAWLVLRTAAARRPAFLIGAAAVGVVTVVALTLLPFPSAALRLVEPNPLAMAFGAVRFLVTPQPWAIEPEYGYLTLPAILHWLTIVPAALGGVLLWRSGVVGRLLVIYLLTVTLFYAAVPILQGPRHRVQVAFVLAWMQYNALYAVTVVGAARARRETVAEA